MLTAWVELARVLRTASQAFSAGFAVVATFRRGLDDLDKFTALGHYLFFHGLPIRNLNTGIHAHAVPDDQRAEIVGPAAVILRADLPTANSQDWVSDPLGDLGKQGVGVAFWVSFHVSFFLWVYVDKFTGFTPG